MANNSIIEFSDVGGTTIEKLAKRFSKIKSLAREVDLVIAMQHQKLRILKRTARGLDFDGKTFTRYNRTRPVYVYPEGSGKTRTKRARTAAKRSRDSLFLKLRKPVKGPNKSKPAKTRKGIKFPSYEAMKRAFGINVVDMRSIRSRARHMMDVLVVKAGGSTVRKRGGNSDRPGLSVSLVVEGRKQSRRMSIHGLGLGSQPVRRVMAMSALDRVEFLNDVTRNIAERLTGKGEV